MGLFDGLKAGVKDLKDTVSSTKFGTIEKIDPTGKQLIMRYPEQGSAEIMSGTTLLVREFQSAVFVSEGRAMDVLGPGSHQLTTKVLPVVSKYIDKLLFDQGKSPFRSEIYFVNHIDANLTWGTKQAINFFDPVFKMTIPLRGFGEFVVRIGHGDNVNLFINQIVLGQGVYTTEKLNDRLRSRVIAKLNDTLQETLKKLKVSTSELGGYYDEIAAAIKAKIHDDFAKYGIELREFVIEAITPPKEIQDKIEKAAGMAFEAQGIAAFSNVDVGKYQQYAAAESMQNISKQEDGRGSMMGQMMEVGLGLAAAGGMMQQQRPQQQQYAPPPQQQYAPPQQPMGAPCPQCQNPLPQGAKFCAACGAKTGGGQPCPQCQNPLPPGAKFCAACGTKIDAGSACPECQAQLPPGAKFCAACGAKTGPQEIQCPECQAKLPPGTKFCASCGTKIG